MHVSRAGGRSPIDWQPVITSLSHPNKDGRGTDSCSVLLQTHQCGIYVLMEGYVPEMYHDLTYELTRNSVLYTKASPLTAGEWNIAKDMT